MTIIYDLGSVFDVEITGTLTYSSVNTVFAFSQIYDSVYNRIGLAHMSFDSIEFVGATDFIDSFSADLTSPVNFKIRYENGIGTVWINNVQIGQVTMNIQPRYLVHHSWNGRKTLTYSNLKVYKL